MRQSMQMLGLILACVVVIDLAVAALLSAAGARGQLGSLVQYFEYGRSVPGKLDQWQDRPEARGNLTNVAWLPEALEVSAQAFAAETTREAASPTVRGYGMSFVNNILQAAQSQSDTLRLDLHSGPGAPPNYTYASFLQDRPNRRAGDVVVLGVLSSSVAAMAALSNQTWVFEQPAPFAYPIFRPDPTNTTGLIRVEPMISSLETHEEIFADPVLRQSWHRQLRQEDAFYSVKSYGVPWLDRSPFVRLLRRSLATDHIAKTKVRIFAGDGYPYREVLNRQIVDFARVARADGQIPVVMLVQSRDPGDPDLLAISTPSLALHDIPYLATSEHFDPRNPAGFLGDGHYKKAVDQIFGAAFLRLIAQHATSPQ